MKRLLAGLGLLTLTACTPSQLAKWVEWHEQDPEAAIAFANQPHIQEQLQQRSQLTNNHADRWEDIAWCESGRQWDLRASNRTGNYGGGLMIRDNVWVAYGGREYAPTADRATKAQQIDIAERILADVGWKAWDCA